MWGDGLSARRLIQSIRFSVINSLLERKIEKRPDKVRLHGRILFLTEDPELIKRQLAGEDLRMGHEESSEQSQVARRHFDRRNHSGALLFLL